MAFTTVHSPHCRMCCLEVVSEIYLHVLFYQPLLWVHFALYFTYWCIQ